MPRTKQPISFTFFIFYHIIIPVLSFLVVVLSMTTWFVAPTTRAQDPEASPAPVEFSPLQPLPDAASLWLEKRPVCVEAKARHEM